MATINGNNGSNVLHGTAFDDIINGLGGHDDLFGHGGNDELNGSNGRDTLDGGADNDTLNGGGGRDRLIGGAGDDTINGDSGRDTVVFTGNLADYVITQNPDGSFVVQDMRTGTPDGTDTVRTVERFEFADGTYTDANVLAENQAARAALNNAPVANDDTASVDEDSSTTINVLANDTDADNDTLSVTVANASNGSVTINGDNTLTYTPTADFNGSDTITYTVDDGNGGTDTASVTVTVNPVNDAPTAIDLATPLVGTVRNAVILNAGFEADVYADGGAANSVTEWTLTGFPAGSWNADIDRFTSEAPEGFNTLFARGDATASQTLSETLSANTDLKLTFQVGDDLEAPDSSSWSASLYAGSTLLKMIDNSDFDPANDSFITATLELSQAELAAFSADFGQALRIEFFGGAASGQWAFFDDVALEVTEYAPAPPAVDENDRGAVVGDLSTTDIDAGDSHTYTVSDNRFEVVGGQLKLKGGVSLDFDTEPSVDVIVTSTDSGGLSVDRTFTIAVNDTGDVEPVAVDDAATTDENVQVTVDVLANDSDGDGDTLTVTSASATHGTVVINADNTITYTPNPDYHGSDDITYTISDGYGGEDTGNVLVTVNQANELPAATDDDAGDTDYETPLVIQASQLLANDSDADGDTLTVQSVHSAQNGTVSMDASGNITFTPDAGFSGNTTFKYTVTDGIDTVDATVNLFVEVDFSDYIGNWWAETIDLSGSPLPCFIDCGRGNDTLIASDLRDAIVGGLGDDNLNGGGGDDDFLVGLGDGYDRFEGGTGYDVVKATAENVKIGLIGDFMGTVEEFSCAGFAGVSITGTWQWQVMDFSNVTLTDIEFIDAGFGNDTVTGSAGNDVIIGNKGDDTLHGHDGDDDFLIRLGDGFDVFDGGAGYDQILADGANIKIGFLNDFNNAVEEISANGHSGVSIAGKWYAQSFDFSNTILDGITQIDLDGGDDTAIGSTGADTIIGGRGNDTLTGNLGADTFVFRNYEGQDVLKDFTIGDDIVRLEGVAGFSSFAEVQAALAQEGDHTRLTFNNDHSILFENTLVGALTSDQFEFV